jgi:hypothetical protein
MRLLRIAELFDHANFVFEPKIDGFRTLAYIRGHQCQLVSRNGTVFKSWQQLAEEIAHAVRVNDAILDGEICCLDPDGRSNFNNLLFRREWPYLYAFDLLRVDERIFEAYRCSSANANCWGTCRRLTVACSTWITLPSADAICSARPASATSRASSASGHAVRIRPTEDRRRG